MYTKLHCQGFFLPDQIRHLLKKLPQTVICILKSFVFLLKPVLTLQKLRNITGCNLRIGYPRLCPDCLFRKLKDTFIPKAVKPQLFIQTTHGFRRLLQRSLQLVKRLNPVFSQPVREHQHSVIDQTNHPVFIKKTDCNRQTVKAFPDSIHRSPFTPCLFHVPGQITKTFLLFKHKTRKTFLQVTKDFITLHTEMYFFFRFFCINKK